MEVKRCPVIHRTDTKQLTLAFSNSLAGCAFISVFQLQAGSTFKSRLPLASNDARLDLSIVSKTVITNGTRTAIISSLPQLSKHVATPEKAKPQLRFDNDTSFEESTSDDDGVERTLWARQADDSLDTWRSRPRIVDYASTTSDDASLETTVDSAGFSNTQSFYGQTLGRPQAQRHNEFAHVSCGSLL